MTLAAALAATHARAFRTDRAWSETEFADLLGNPGILFTGNATAFVLGRIILDEVEILTLATDPVAQRNGLARAALAQFETDARRRGAGMVFLEVAQDNIAAQRLYAASSYGQVGLRPGYYARTTGRPVAALILRKAL